MAPLRPTLLKGARGPTPRAPPRGATSSMNSRDGPAGLMSDSQRPRGGKVTECTSLKKKESHEWGREGCNPRTVLETFLRRSDVSVSIKGLRTRGQSSAEQRAMGRGAVVPNPFPPPAARRVGEADPCAAPNKVAESSVS